jgi:DNA-directed RNA polymerase
MPNLIHSLDACSLALLVKLIREDVDIVEGDSVYKTCINFYSVHDCYATTMNKLGSVIKYLKIVYTMLYTDNNYLRKFDKEIKNLIIQTLGEDCFYKDENEDTLKIKLNENVKIEYPNVDLIILGNIKKKNKKKEDILNGNPVI